MDPNFNIRQQQQQHQRRRREEQQQYQQRQQQQRRRREEQQQYQIEKYRCIARDKCGNHLENFRKCMIDNSNIDMCEKEMYMISHCFSTNGIPIE